MMHDDQPDVTTRVICRAIAVLVFLFALSSFLQLVDAIAARSQVQRELPAGNNYP